MLYSYSFYIEQKIERGCLLLQERVCGVPKCVQLASLSSCACARVCHHTLSALRGKIKYKLGEAEGDEEGSVG